MARRTSTTTTHTGDVFPPPPAIPDPQKTEEEIARDRAMRAETMRLMAEIKENLYQQQLERAVSLALMAQRRQGPLVEFFIELGRKYAKLADEGPRRPGPGLRVIQGGAD